MRVPCTGLGANYCAHVKKNRNPIVLRFNTLFCLKLVFIIVLIANFFVIISVNWGCKHDKKNI